MSSSSLSLLSLSPLTLAMQLLVRNNSMAVLISLCKCYESEQLIATITALCLSENHHWPLLSAALQTEIETCCNALPSFSSSLSPSLTNTQLLSPPYFVRTVLQRRLRVRTSSSSVPSTSTTPFSTWSPMSLTTPRATR